MTHANNDVGVLAQLISDGLLAIYFGAPIYPQLNGHPYFVSQLSDDTYSKSKFAQNGLMVNYGLFEVGRGLAIICR